MCVCVYIFFFLDDLQLFHIFSFNPLIREGKVYLVGCKPHGKSSRAPADWVVKEQVHSQDSSGSRSGLPRKPAPLHRREPVGHTGCLPLVVPAFSQGNVTLTLKS